MHKIMTGYMLIIVTVIACAAFPPLLVVLVPLMICRARAFRRAYLASIDDAQTERRARMVQSSTQHNMRVAKAWR